MPIKSKKKKNVKININRCLYYINRFACFFLNETEVNKHCIAYKVTFYHNKYIVPLPILVLVLIWSSLLKLLFLLALLVFIRSMELFNRSSDPELLEI